ncbi:VOC family protein [Tenggerimyces flavus]|uniref:VOC family protein n=1 Tax=Tenggerimyces flavus TaxID=1708749 RepID=A0ABV7YGU4_9ACTN|nr:VOC family protein [Tenggerimyces flavus]MBM7789900.1 catechol 2,3-dioxygenase-like lactoylglutathione lyase family enzyme [Tenggerimyces flavus]
MSTQINDLRTIAIPVRDQDKALEFYRNTLGFEVRLDGAFGDGRWLEVAAPGALTSIALLADPARAGVDTGIRLTTSSADSDHAHLLAAGVDVDAEVLRMGDFVPPMFTFRDVDGNTLVIVEVTDH